MMKAAAGVIAMPSWRRVIRSTICGLISCEKRFAHEISELLAEFNDNQRAHGANLLQPAPLLSDLGAPLNDHWAK